MVQQSHPTLRVGVPYRTEKEELKGERELEPYFEAIRAAGGMPVPISLRFDTAELKETALTLDAVVLSGSPADVDPCLFQATKHAETANADPNRERTDFLLIQHALADRKPLLAICYGIQSLNVYLGGTLLQDIPSELGLKTQHDWENEKGAPETFHRVRIDPRSQLAQIVGDTEITVNSSHHQSIAQTGNDLRAVAWAPDGMVEAVEWPRNSRWIVGVQWHPERLVRTDSVSQKLFAGLIEAANARRLLTRT